MHGEIANSGLDKKNAGESSAIETKADRGLSFASLSQQVSNNRWPTPCRIRDGINLRGRSKLLQGIAPNTAARARQQRRVGSDAESSEQSSLLLRRLRMKLICFLLPMKTAFGRTALPEAALVTVCVAAEHRHLQVSSQPTPIGCLMVWPEKFNTRWSM